MSSLSPAALIVDHTQDGMFLVDCEDDGYRVERVNRAYEEMTGMAAEVIEGRTPAEILEPAAAERVVRCYDRCVEVGETIEYDETLQIGGEETVWHTKLTPILEDDAVDRLVGATRDITERRRRDEEREALLDALRAMYDVTTEHGLSFDDKLDRVLALGRDYLGLSYGFMTEIERGEDGDGRQEIVASIGGHDLLQTGAACPLSEAYCRKTIETDGLLAIGDAVADGWEDDPAYELFDLGAYIGGRIGVEGELYGTLCFAASDPRSTAFSDEQRSFVRLATKWMSYELERERAERAIERERDRFEEFAEIVAHDVRNPLNAAMGQVEMAREAVEGHDDRFDLIERPLERIESLVADMLELARHDREIDEVSSVDLRALTEDAVASVDIEPGNVVIQTEATVTADRERLRQLLENLLRNAVEHGGSDVTVTVGDLDGGDGFYVADDGPGIPEDRRSEVLEAGYSTDDAGTGFGLAIVARIARAHGWTVAVTEAADGGARFEFRSVRRSDAARSG